MVLEAVVIMNSQEQINIIFKQQLCDKMWIPQSVMLGSITEIERTNHKKLKLLEQFGFFLKKISF